MPGRGNRKCKGPEARTNNICRGQDKSLEHSKERGAENNVKEDGISCGSEHLLLSNYFVPGPVLRAGDSAVNKRDNSHPHGAYGLVGRHQ